MLRSSTDELSSNFIISHLTYSLMYMKILTNFYVGSTLKEPAVGVYKQTIFMNAEVRKTLV